MDDNYIDEDVDDPGAHQLRMFYLENHRPVDKLPSMGQQLKDAWAAEHGDEEYPT